MHHSPAHSLARRFLGLFFSILLHFSKGILALHLKLGVHYPINHLAGIQILLLFLFSSVRKYHSVLMHLGHPSQFLKMEDTR